MAEKDLRPIAASSELFKQLFPVYAAASLQALITREGAADVGNLTKKATEIAYAMLQTHNEFVHDLRMKESSPRIYPTE
jgi:hypothetical protein